MVKPTPSPAANPAANLKGDPNTRCVTCNKLFHEDRFVKHQQICGTRSRQQTKFDAGKHRVQGTQAEKYYKKRRAT